MKVVRGWPSFFEALPGVFETKIDNLIGSPRTEYHCKKCGGHHGHIFDDGPKPTGKRYCNNGVMFSFYSKKEIKIKQQLLLCLQAKVLLLKTCY